MQKLDEALQFHIQIETVPLGIVLISLYEVLLSLNTVLCAGSYHNITIKKSLIDFPKWFKRSQLGAFCP